MSLAALARWVAAKPVAFRKVYATGRATPWHSAKVHHASRYGESWRCGCWMHTGNSGDFEFRYRPVPTDERCAWWKTRP